jgi:hypothetical protein
VQGKAIWADLSADENNTEINVKKQDVKARSRFT